MMVPVNPYVAGNPVGDSSAFVGRADVLREVLRILRRANDNAVVLYGQRRIGKTSILQHLAAWLSRRGPYRLVYFDLQDKAAWPLGRVLQELARTVADGLGQPDPDLGPDLETGFRQEWLPGILGNLPNGSSLVLLLDEFDVLADPKAEQAAAAFFPYLRQLMTSDPRRLQFIFVIGRNVDDLDNIALSLFKGAPALRVSLLNLEETEDLVRLAHANDTLHWTKDAVRRVEQLTHGHPFLTQQLCSRIWERAYEEEPAKVPTVRPADVERAVPGTLDASRNSLEWLWDGLPPAERVVASALAEAGPGPIAQEELERLLHESGVRVVIRELQNAPQLLQGWDLIEPVDGGYRFRVELLRRWIATHKPLKRVQEELDRIEPVADSLYQAGLGLYRGGQLEQALGPLRQAIMLNPNHIGANHLLADILLAQGQAGEARQVLERLYEYQPSAARHRLVQALLAQAQDAESDEEQLALFERVLELDPTQREASAGRLLVWRRRGDAARQAGDLEVALEAYRAAGLAEKAAEIVQDIRYRDLADGLRDLEELEQAKRYQDALDLAHELADETRDLRDWTADLERLEHKTHLAELYQRGLGALQGGDWRTARNLLAEVVALEPEYEDAPRYLHLALTGILQAQLETGARTHPQRQRELGQHQTQLGAERRADDHRAAGETQVESRSHRLRSARRVSEYLNVIWVTLTRPFRALPEVSAEATAPRTRGWLVSVVASYPFSRIRSLLDQYRAGDWLVSTLAWLPFLIPVLALGVESLPHTAVAPSKVYLWISLGLALAWVLTGWLGRTSNRVAVNVAAVAAFVVAFGVAICVIGSIVFGGSYREVTDVAPGMVLGLTFIVAAGATSGVADAVSGDMAGAVSAAMATAMAVVVIGVVAFGVTVGIAVGVVGTVLGVVLGVVVVGAVAGMVGGVSRSPQVALGLSVLIHVFLTWFCFLDGCRVFEGIGGG